MAAGCGSVVPGLGVCLSELIATKSTDPSAPPLPSVSGINTPTTVVRKRLEWWQILLMALGCAFIFVGVLWCCRRRQQKKKRAERTELFAIRSGGRQTGWRWRLIKFLQGLFGRGRRQRRVTIKPGVKIVHLGPGEHEEGLVLDKLRAAEEARAYYYTLPPKLKPSTTTTMTMTAQPKVEEEDMIRLIGSYNRPLSPRPEQKHHHHTDHNRIVAQNSGRNYRDDDDDARSSLSDMSSSNSRMSAPSLYSQLTGMPRKAPEPKMPVKREEIDLLTSRFSGSTFSSAERRKEAVVAASKKGVVGSSKTPFWK